MNKRDKDKILNFVLDSMKKQKPRITKEDMGEKLGVSGTKWNKIATFDRIMRNQNIDDLEKIAEILKIPLEQILFENKGVQIGDKNKNVTINSENVKIGDTRIDPEMQEVLKIEDPEERKLAFQFLINKYKK